MTSVVSRRWAVGAAVISVALGAACHGSKSPVSDKEVVVANLRRVDAIVTWTDGVQRKLDSSDLVDHYARLPAARGATGATSGEGPIVEGVCAARKGGGFAVQSTAENHSELIDWLGRRDVRTFETGGAFDIEVFVAGDSSPDQVRGVRAMVAADRELTKFTYVEREQHMDSYRMTLRRAASARAVIDRYEGEPGIEFGRLAVQGTDLLPPMAAADLEPLKAVIFMNVTATPRLIGRMNARLVVDPRVSSWRKVDQADAYAIVKRMTRSAPDVARRTVPADLPVTFEVRIRSARSAETWAKSYDFVAGVDAVVDPAAGPLCR